MPLMPGLPFKVEVNFTWYFYNHLISSNIDYDPRLGYRAYGRRRKVTFNPALPSGPSMSKPFREKSEQFYYFGQLMIILNYIVHE